MSNLIPLSDEGHLPAHLQAFASEGNEFGFSGAAYPSLSIKGKVFTIVRDKEKTLVTKPGTDGEPAASLDVVILNVGPKNGYAKTFYSEGYQEGGSQRPTCFSIDGVEPHNGSEEKQSSKCALCPQHAQGSGATSQNPKARACKSSKLLAVAPAGQLTDAMLLRVPGASTIELNKYGEFLAKRGVKAAAVVTRIGFDYSVAHPALTFKAMGLITPEMAEEAGPLMNSTLVQSIIGEKVLVGEGYSELPAPVARTAIYAPKPAPAPAKAATTWAKTTVLPGQSTEKAPVAAVKPAKKAVKPPIEVSDAGIDSALDTLDFD